MSDEPVPSPEEVLGKEVSVYLATTESKQPRVRPVTLVQNSGELYVLTGTKDAKIQQIKKNQKVEIVTPVHHGERIGYIRFDAIATIVKDSKVRTRIAKATSYFFNYWDTPDHPDYTLVQIKPVNIEYLKPGKMYPDPVEKLDFDR